MSGIGSGIGSGIDYSLLFPAAAGTGSDLQSALSGTATTNSGGPANALAALNVAIRDETRDVAAVAKQPQVGRAIAAFTQALAAAKTPADLLKNPQALQVLLTANGLGDQAAYPALAQRALLANANDKTSLPYKLSNAAWAATTRLYDFANQGLKVIRSPAVIATLSRAYAEVTWRKSLDATTPGLSTALDFRARAGTITKVDQVLGDGNFRKVVLGAFGIPPQIAFQELTAQENAVAQRLDLGRLRDPHYVAGITQRYLQSVSTTAPAASSLESLAIRSQGLIA